jgi:hypothetical protein
MERKLDANGPIAPQISALRRPFPAKKPLRGTTAVPRPRRQPLFSGRNVLGCHGISSVKKGLGRPQTGSALHHLVTALSVKKALMNRRGFYALSSHFRAGDALRLTGAASDAERTHSGKMRSRTRLPDCADDRVKE